MSTDVLLSGLTSYSLQLGLLVAIGLGLPALVRLRQPRICLHYWRLLLISALVLPFVGWAATPAVDASESRAIEGVLVVGLGALERTDVGSWSLSRLVIALLVGGVLARGLWLLIGLAALARWRSAGMELDPLPLPLREAQEAVGTRARFLISDRVSTPLTFGWRHPTVLLPADFGSLPAPAQRAAACHELVHVARRDWPQALVEEGVKLLLWFHPAVWLVLARMALSREQVVDAEVVRLLGRRRDYLEALLRIASSYRRPLAIAAALLGRSNLKQRVRAMSREVSMSRTRLSLSLAAVATVLLLAGWFTLTALPSLAAPLVGGHSAQESASDEDSILYVKGDVTKPVKIHSPAPVYSDEAREKRTQGVVIVQTVIKRDGTVGAIKVLKELEDGLTESAIEAIEQWRFEPATLDGEPVDVYFNITVNFQLEKDGEEAKDEA